jgi:hypothetical protein
MPGGPACRAGPLASKWHLLASMLRLPLNTRSSAEVRLPDQEHANLMDGLVRILIVLEMVFKDFGHFFFQGVRAHIHNDPPVVIDSDVNRCLEE